MQILTIAGLQIRQEGLIILIRLNNRAMSYPVAFALSGQSKNEIV